jgi:hypothetical protein
VADGYVFLAGGLHGDPLSGAAPLVEDVMRARIADDGTLLEWTAQPKLPQGVATHASFVYGGHLYLAGGIDDLGGVIDDVRLAPISDHALGKWGIAATLPVARAHVHQLPVVGGHVYSVAGAIDGTLDSTDVVAVGAFP